MLIVSQHVPQDLRKVPITMWRKEHQEQWGAYGGSAATESKVEAGRKLTEGIID